MQILRTSHDADCVGAKVLTSGRKPRSGRGDGDSEEGFCFQRLVILDAGGGRVAPGVPCTSQRIPHVAEPVTLSSKTPLLGRSVSIDQAARLLNVSRRTIYNRIRDGRLRTMRTLGGSQRVLVDSLNELGVRGVAFAASLAPVSAAALAHDSATDGFPQ